MARTERRNILLMLPMLLLTSIVLAGAQQNRPPVLAAHPTFQPRFMPGQVMRYRMTLESGSSTRQSGSVKDPQGPAGLDVTWDATIRMEVFAVEGGPAAASAVPIGPPVRLRMTYENSRATVRSDTVDPQTDRIEQQYARLTGHSIEFRLDGSRVSDVRGLEDFVADDRARSTVEQWIVQFSALSAVPAKAGVPGQKWNSSQPADLPLAGFSWRTDATYLRNEPCRLAGAPSGAGAPVASTRSERADCAVILSRLALITTRPLRDPTPDDYRRNNLRTSGRWTGSGQGRMYVSLDTGWVVSSTQESTQEMDITIADAAPASTNAVRHAGSVTTRSQVLLLTAPPE
jgi:hypothetical protein